MIETLIPTLVPLLPSTGKESCCACCCCCCDFCCACCLVCCFCGSFYCCCDSCGNPNQLLMQHRRSGGRYDVVYMQQHHQQPQYTYTKTFELISFLEHVVRYSYCSTCVGVDGSTNNIHLFFVHVFLLLCWWLVVVFHSERPFNDIHFWLFIGVWFIARCTIVRMCCPEE